MQMKRTRRIEVVGGVGEGLSRLNVLGVTWGFDLESLLHKRAQQVPTIGDAGDGTAETMGSSQRGAVGAASAQAGRTETTEMMGSSQGDAMDARSTPGRESRKRPGRSSTSNTDQGTGEDSPAILSGRAANKLSNWGPSDSAGPDPGSEPTAGGPS